MPSDLTPGQAADLAACRDFLVICGLSDRFELVEIAQPIDPADLPPEVVFLDDARAARDLRRTLAGAVL